jgi:uncharacterized protein YecT (DUF1311 family)
MRNFVLTVGLAAAAWLGGAAEARAQSQAELNREACAQYKVADDELNKIYAQILQEYKTDAAFVGSMRAAQRAWVAFRDAHLEAMYPGADKQLQYGSAYPMCRCYALAEVTRERAEVLRRWVEGVEEGDVCAGSIKTRAGERAKTRRKMKGRRVGASS